MSSSSSRPPMPRRRQVGQHREGRHVRLVDHQPDAGVGHDLARRRGRRGSAPCGSSRAPGGTHRAARAPGSRRSRWRGRPGCRRRRMGSTRSAQRRSGDHAISSGPGGCPAAAPRRPARASRRRRRCRRASRCAAERQQGVGQALEGRRAAPGSLDSPSDGRGRRRAATGLAPSASRERHRARRARAPRRRGAR